jgi:hypothetical protein
MRPEKGEHMDEAKRAARAAKFLEGWLAGHRAASGASNWMPTPEEEEMDTVMELAMEVVDSVEDAVIRQIPAIKAERVREAIHNLALFVCDHPVADAAPKPTPEDYEEAKNLLAKAAEQSTKGLLAAGAQRYELTYRGATTPTPKQKTDTGQPEPATGQPAVENEPENVYAEGYLKPPEARIPIPQVLLTRGEEDNPQTIWVEQLTYDAKGDPCSRLVRGTFVPEEVDLESVTHPYLESLKVPPKPSTALKGVLEKMQGREAKGLEKYGVTVDRVDLDLFEWITHAQEEAMDLSLYLERILGEMDAPLPLKVAKIGESTIDLESIFDAVDAWADTHAENGGCEPMDADWLNRHHGDLGQDDDPAYTFDENFHCEKGGE